MIDYDTDCYRWTQTQAAALRANDVATPDFDNLAEEIESLGHSDRRAIVRHPERLPLYLLNWREQPQGRDPSWRRTIRHARREIAKLLMSRAQLIKPDRCDEGIHLVRLDGQRGMNDVQAAAERGVLHGTRAVGIPDGVSQRKHRPAKRDLEGTIQHVLHRGVPLREVRPGFVVLERRFIAVHLGKGEELGVGLVLDDIEPMALGLVQDGAGAVCNRGLDEVVDVVLFDCESHHENVRNSLQARSDARLERVTCEDGLPVRRSILDSLG